MLIGSVVIALAGAFCMALGSALQERDAVRAPGKSVARFGLLVHLAQRPRWVLGTVAAGAGVTLHLVALSGAPLTVIQPIGVTGLLFAIVLSMLFTRRPVRAGQIVAGLAVTAGLAGVLTLFPHTARTPQMTTVTALLLAGTVVAVGIAAFAAARHLRAGARGVLLAAVGGAALGTTSAIARVIAAGTVQDPSALIGWLTPIALGVALFGGLMMQNAYRTGHFAAAYAVLLVADPVVGAGLGALLLGEGLPTTPLAQAGATVSAAVAAAGIAVLAKARNQNPEAAARRGGPAPGGRPAHPSGDASPLSTSASAQEQPDDRNEGENPGERRPGQPTERGA
ncbi:DMT family transporter [Nocardiopsis baichengensis]|uniref:DMT family transporter n=1 Tax=Nocardiopsis baichengensis TaxID=280240 RepID=UPI0003467A3D|nr:DMT family transporter [Nocardiopsis baichengensis]